MDSVTVILPVYNEAWLIGSVYSRVADYARLHPTWKFQFVDDGSTDETPGLLRERLSSENAPTNIDLLQRKPNAGKAIVIRESILAATDDLVLFTDGDLAYDLSHLDQLCEALQHTDIAIGSRSLAREPQHNIRFIRRAMGGLFNRFVRLLTGVTHTDTQAGLKGFRNIPAKAIFRRQHVTNFAFDAELLFLAHRLGLSVSEIPAIVSPRHSYKKSKMNLLKDPPRMLLSLLRMRIMHRGVKWSDETRSEPDSTASIEVFPDARTRITRHAQSEREQAGVSS